MKNWDELCDQEQAQWYDLDNTSHLQYDKVQDKAHVIRNIEIEVNELRQLILQPEFTYHYINENDKFIHYMETELDHSTVGS